MTNPWDNLVTQAKLRELYAKGIARYGGDPSPEMPGCHERSLGAAWTAESYLEAEAETRPGLLFAAHLLYYLVFNHCHSDGNKRLAWEASMYVLAVQGLSVNATDDEAQELVDDLIQKRVIGGLAVAQWMADRLIDAVPLTIVRAVRAGGTQLGGTAVPVRPIG